MTSRSSQLSQRPPRIVMFTPGLTERGGLARHSTLLAEGFAASGWDVRVITRAGSLRRPRIRRDSGLLVIEVPGFGHYHLGVVLYLLIAIPLGMLWVHRATACLAVHLGSTTVAAGLCAMAGRVPYTALSTSTGPWGEVVELSKLPRLNLRRWMAVHATYLVAQSETSAAELADLVTSDHIAIVPNPLEIPDPLPLRETPTVLFLGRLSAEKDPGGLIAAWQKVIGRRPDARLDIAGAGLSARSVEREVRDQVAADPTLANTITFIGWIEDVSASFASHDVFVQASSTFEGMSNSLLEACAHGRVVVASDIGPNRAVLGDDYPLLFITGDVEDLAAKLLTAMGDPSIRSEAVRRVLRAVADNEVMSVIRRHERLIANDHPRSVPSTSE